MAEDSELPDITPHHLPVGLARQVLKKAANAKAMAVVLVLDGEDSADAIWFDCCGIRTSDVIWAVKNMEYLMMREIHGDDD